MNFLAIITTMGPWRQNRLNIKISSQELTPEPGLPDVGLSSASSCVIFASPCTPWDSLVPAIQWYCWTIFSKFLLPGVVASWEVEMLLETDPERKEPLPPDLCLSLTSSLRFVPKA